MTPHLEAESAVEVVLHLIVVAACVDRELQPVRIELARLGRVERGRVGLPVDQAEDLRPRLQRNNALGREVRVVR